MSAVEKEPATAPATAASVANEFLALSRQDGIPIDQMKLQKLLFYAQAWHLAEKGRPLFDEDIEAWAWGPVVRSVYTSTAGSGRTPIEGDVSELRKVGPSFLDFRFTFPKLEDTETKQFVKEVWDVHKNYTGVQLSNSTHAPGEPWTIVKEQYGSLDTKPIIPNELIRAVFKKKIEDASDKAAG